MSGGSGSASSVRGRWFTVTGVQASLPVADHLASAEYLRWPHVSVLELGAFPAAPSVARRHMRVELGEWGVPFGIVGDAEMICSELVTNGLQATCALVEPQPIGLRLLANRQRLVIEVWDSHPGEPVRRPAPADEAESGRGLAIVHELSSRWGSRRLSVNVKAVWAELLLPARHLGEGKAHG